MGNARVMVPGDAVAFASAIVFATGITIQGLGPVVPEEGAARPSTMASGNLP